MRLTELRRLIEDEFGEAKGNWISHSHVLTRFGATTNELIARGEDLRAVWLGLCEDFEIPESRRLGVDRGKLK